MSSPEEAFQVEECPCDTYHEGHLTGKAEVWGADRKLAWLYHASSLYSNAESAQDDISIQAYTLNFAATAWRLISS